MDMYVQSTGTDIRVRKTAPNTADWEYSLWLGTNIVYLNKAEATTLFHQLNLALMADEEELQA